MHSRWSDFLTSDGEKPWRNRDKEFEITSEDVTIRGEPLTVLQAINRQLTHYGYHVGQIVLLSKHFAGNEWESLSVRRGRSAEFNANPSNYL
jgi:hypothetical protein